MNYPTAPANLTESQFWGHFYRLLDETAARCEEILARHAAQQAQAATGEPARVNTQEVITDGPKN